ncbi:glycosyltransferase family 39 protein [Streptomyces sodiiphilus]|uniref:Glycosyltransferase family 39 protein n=1 Tax=Streptomyces sodiiphilus TaxID=226217 RepID=A0ABN2PFP0_9ACTN
MTAANTDTGRSGPQKPDGHRNEAPADPGRRADLIAAAVAAALFAVADAVGAAVDGDNVLQLNWPPLYADWEPHVGPGTVPALVTGTLLTVYGPAAARRLSTRALPWAATAGSLVWIWTLAMIDGWERGITERLTSRYEYLAAVDEVRDLRVFLTTFTERVPLDRPDNWPVHVAGHPPGALLTFVGLDRIGLGGGAWAGMFCVVTAATAAAAVLVTVRALAGEETARRAAPFVVLAPAAVWMGVSADAHFAAVAAWAVALLALAATGAARFPAAAALGSGLLFGWLLYLSYGLALMGTVALAVLVAARSWRPLPWALAGIAVWVVAFTAAGFWWFDGYTAVVDRYHQGAGGVRPYAYFVWANLAVQVLTVGLAGVAALRRWAVALPGTARRAARDLGSGSPLTGQAATVVLVAGALTAILLATASGMSKAETERIWLPFVLWLLPAAALLPARWARGWLAAQAAVALAVNHLLLTGW